MSTDNTQEKNKYRSSLGATLLFSSVQFYQILVRVIKSKFVALFIGPAGMGISSLLHSTTDLISASTNLGLKTSGVKSIASANAENDKDRITKTITVLRRLILLTGLFGLVICAVLSPVWSKVSFGNNEYIISFIIVSLVVLFDQLNNGELVLLQGLQKKKSLAQANVIGQTVGLLITVPLYYFFRLKAIVAVLVISSLITFVISRIYTSKLNVGKADVTWRETFSIGREMIRLGFFLSLQFFLEQAVVYLIRNYVSNIGGVEEVGLYSAGTSIVSTYLGLVFAAIATDYFPRLAATKSNEEMSDAVHTQAEISILLFAPLIIAFILFIKPIIILLYSDKFLPIEIMMYWSIGATLFQAMGWALSYTVLAKAKPLYFFLNELGAKFYSVPLRLLGYKFFGLAGFGMATLVVYVLYLLQLLMVSKHLFGFSYNLSIWKLFILLNMPVALVVLIKYCLPEFTAYFVGLLIMIILSIYVLIVLDKKMDLRKIIEKRFRPQ